MRPENQRLQTCHWSNEERKNTFHYPGNDLLLLLLTLIGDNGSNYHYANIIIKDIIQSEQYHQTL